MKNDFNMCPMCGSNRVENIGNRKWICPQCGFDLYCNVAAAVGIIIYDKENNILFETRAKEPQKGKIAIPGGFVDFDESAEQAAMRECKEEIGCCVSDLQFLCTNPNTYPYKNFEYKTCDIFFMALLPPQFKSMQDFIQTLNIQQSEVTSLSYHKVQTQEDIEKLPIAFESTRQTLKVFVQKRQDTSLKS